MKINDLEISVRLANSLNAHCIHTTDQLPKTEAEFLRIPLIGPVGLKELKTALKAVGITWPQANNHTCPVCGFIYY